MAGLLLRAHFPRRRIIQAVAVNVFRYLFRGAARNWFRNLGSTAPALSSMTLLLLLSGLVGLVGFALHNLEQVQAGQASLLHVYMRDGVPAADVNALWDRLAKDPANMLFWRFNMRRLSAEEFEALLAFSERFEKHLAALPTRSRSIDELLAEPTWASVMRDASRAVTATGLRA